MDFIDRIQLRWVVKYGMEPQRSIVSDLLISKDLDQSSYG